MSHEAFPPIPRGAPAEARRAGYLRVEETLTHLLDGETDWIAAMATVVCELHHAFEYFDWTGFYRALPGELLVIGPYQGGHGCLRIPFTRGVCGRAAREARTMFVPDVDAFPDHIACSSSTRSEVVVPVLTPEGRLLAVLDVDSDTPAGFDEEDRTGLERVARMLGARFSG